MRFSHVNFPRGWLRLQLLTFALLSPLGCGGAPTFHLQMLGTSPDNPGKIEKEFSRPKAGESETVSVECPDNAGAASVKAIVKRARVYLTVRCNAAPSQVGETYTEPMAQQDAAQQDAAQEAENSAPAEEE